MQDEAAGHTPAEIEIAPPSEASPTAPAPVNPDEYSRKIRELALRQLNRFIACEAKVLKGDNADAIHDMRVASRRLQQVLDLLYPKPRPAELRKMRAQIRRCRQVLGDVRNCDVLLAIAAKSLGRKRSARRDAWTAVQHFLTARRAENFSRAIRKLGKVNLAVFYLNLKQWLHREKSPDHSDGHHHLHGAAEASAGPAADLGIALQFVWNRFEAQIEDTRHSSRPEVIHGARIGAKRLRYLVEVFHELGVPGSAEVLAWLRELQNHLGDWHDREVLEHMMIEMLARPEFLRDHLPLAMSVEKLILRNRANKTKFQERYVAEFRDSEDFRRLKDWVSYRLASPPAVLVKA